MDTKVIRVKLVQLEPKVQPVRQVLMFGFKILIWEIIFMVRVQSLIQGYIFKALLHRFLVNMKI